MLTASDPETNLVWMDFEMTGLDLERHKLVEIAAIITNSNLEVVEEGPDLIIHQPEQVLKLMDDQVKQMHIKSGLLESILNSRLIEHEAENKLLSFLKKHVNKGWSPLCGNSIYRDKMFVIRYLPKIDEYLHYRLIDISTIKELYRRFRPTRPLYKKSETHRSIDDIK